MGEAKAICWQIRPISCDNIEVTFGDISNVIFSRIQTMSHVAIIDWSVH